MNLNIQKDIQIKFKINILINIKLIMNKIKLFINKIIKNINILIKITQKNFKTINKITLININVNLL